MPVHPIIRRLLKPIIQEMREDLMGTGILTITAMHFILGYLSLRLVFGPGKTPDGETMFLWLVARMGCGVVWSAIIMVGAANARDAWITHGKLLAASICRLYGGVFALILVLLNGAWLATEYPVFNPTDARTLAIKMVLKLSLDPCFLGFVILGLCSRPLARGDWDVALEEYSLDPWPPLHHQPRW